MSATREREETIAVLSQEKVPLPVIRKLLSAGRTLHRLAELECSSEAADRDRVPCPGDYANGGGCLCRDYGSMAEPGQHGDVPRIAVQGDKLQRRIAKLCNAHGLTAVFGGDPRGAVLLVKVPSGRTTDWGQRGVFVA